MRMIMLVQFPIEPFNTIARNGSMGNIMRRILESSKPEAAYFSERDGHRGGIFIVNVNEDAEIPALAEPWFLEFNATVEFRIAMTPEDLLKANVDTLAKKWS